MSKVLSVRAERSYEKELAETVKVEDLFLITVARPEDDYCYDLAGIKEYGKFRVFAIKVEDNMVVENLDIYGEEEFYGYKEGIEEGYYKEDGTFLVESDREREDLVKNILEGLAENFSIEAE